MMSDQLREANRKNEIFKDKIQNFQERIRELEGDLADSGIQKSQLEEELKGLKRKSNEESYAKNLSKKDQIIRNLKEQLERRESQIQEMKDALKSQEKKIRKLGSTNREQGDVIEELEERLRGSSGSKSASEREKKKIKQLRSKVRELEEKAETKELKIAELERKLSFLGTKQTGMEEAQQGFDRRVDELKKVQKKKLAQSRVEYEERIADLEERLNESRLKSKWNGKMRNAKKRRSKHKPPSDDEDSSSSSDHEKEVEKPRKGNFKKRKNPKQIEAVTPESEAPELEKIDSEIEIVKENHKRKAWEQEDYHSKKELKNLRQKCVILEKQLEIALQSYRLSQENSIDLKNNIQCYSQMNKDLTQNRDQFQQEVNEFREDLQYLKKENKQLRDDHSEVEKNYHQSKEKMEELKEAVRRSKEEIVTLEKSHQEAMNQAMGLFEEQKNREIEELVRTKNDKIEELDKLQKEFERYKMKYKKCKGMLKDRMKENKALRKEMSGENTQSIENEEEE